VLSFESRPQILVIEDDETMNEIVKVNLARKDFSVITAFDGPEGLEMARASRPAAIILDRQMPDMDGHEVLQKLKENELTQDIPVMMLTSVNRAGEMVDSLELGATDYVVKPFAVDDFIQRVRKMLIDNGTLPPDVVEEEEAQDEIADKDSEAAEEE